MKLLIIGSGAREHALVWKLAQECEVFASPGNPGIAAECNTFDIQAHNHQGIRDLATKLEADLVLVGPEDPLIQGLADALRNHQIPVFGPGGHGALLEGSKAFAKALMREAAIPTADYQVFTDPGDALEYAVGRFKDGKQVAVKASGAALGKGVFVCDSPEAAEEAIEMMLLHDELGEAGRTVVIEDRIDGKEFSLLTLCSNGSYRSLPVAQDYKRVFDGDRGPNTGGMGTYSPVPWVNSALVEETEVRVVEPILNLMAKKGIDYRGVLFSGLMLQDDTPYCLEFNVRFGDPETQTIMMRLGGGFAEALRAVAAGETVPPFEVLDRAAVSVVLASDGYPGDYRKGYPIRFAHAPEHLKVFHAGTAERGGEIVTNGGRVLTLSAVGDTLEDARSRAYGAVEFVSFPGMHYRLDIASV
ncbi:MAG: phosphoribosylamine--glycine ligase [Fimbriimonadaceae bacterium]